jgi:hypothetical protein
LEALQSGDADRARARGKSAAMSGYSFPILPDQAIAVT